MSDSERDWLEGNDARIQHEREQEALMYDERNNAERALDDLRLGIIGLHRPSTDHKPGFGPYCVGCWEASGEPDWTPSWPCPTVQLVGGWMHDCSERGHPVWWPYGQQCLFCWTRMEVTHEPDHR